MIRVVPKKRKKIPGTRAALRLEPLSLAVAATAVAANVDDGGDGGNVDGGVDVGGRRLVKMMEDGGKKEVLRT
jgi:hypothetical protein